MRKIALPNTDLEVSQIAYGTTGFDGQFPTEQGLALVAEYVRLGGNFIDTAHCYSFWVPGGLGASERFVGTAAREFGREQFVIATKGGHTDGGPSYPRPDGFMSPELVRQDLDESLERLGLPQVELYFLHRDDPRIPVDEIMDAANGLVSSGSTRYLGASNWSAERYLAANRYSASHGLQPFVMLQNQWSLAQPNWPDLDSPGAMRYVENSEIAMLAEAEVPVGAYTPTASGYFASNGKQGGVDSELNRKRLAAVNALAAKRGISPNQVVLAYLLGQTLEVVPILGTRDISHLRDAVGSMGVNLSQEEIEVLKA